MGEFFKVWRRRIGAVALVITCVFMAGWIRSFSSSDGVEWNCVCCAANGRIYLMWPSEPSPVSWKLPEWSVTDVVVEEEESALNSITWKWRQMGFGDGEFTIIGMRCRLILLPYWSIVAPLTLLSAYLLLSKTQVTKPLEST